MTSRHHKNIRSIKIKADNKTNPTDNLFEIYNTKETTTQSRFIEI
jgi:hypothetical protein